jgi:hypothetical protein
MKKEERLSVIRQIMARNKRFAVAPLVEVELPIAAPDKEETIINEGEIPLVSKSLVNQFEKEEDINQMEDVLNPESDGILTKRERRILRQEVAAQRSADFRAKFGHLWLAPLNLFSNTV